MTRQRHLARALLLAAAIGGTAQAAATNWTGSSATWNDSNGAVWDNGYPVGADTVNLTQATAGDITVDFASTALAGTYGTLATWFGPVTLANAGGGTTTLAVGTGDSLFVNPMTIGPGGKLSVSDGTVRTYGTGTVPTTYLTMTGGTLEVSGTGTVNGGFLVADTLVGPVTISVSGSANLRMEDNGAINKAFYLDSATQPITFNIAGGTVYGHNLRVGRNATLNQSGGSITGIDWTYGLRIADGGTYNFSGGTINSASGAKFAVDNGGTVNQTGTLASRGTTINGTYFLGNASTSGTLTAGYDGLSMASTGLLRGWGTVGGSNRAMFGSGTVIADGYGTPRDLDIAFGFTWETDNIRPFTNTTDNPTTGTRGWYAVNQGRLLLPRTGSNSASTEQSNWVRATNGNAYSIGETWNDATPDLVNSARVVFTGLTDNAAGYLSETLYAIDRADIFRDSLPATAYDLLGVYDFALVGNTFTSFDLTIRYDHLAAGSLEGAIRLLHRVGGVWVDVTGSVDTTNKLVTAYGQSSFSLFAIGVPEPGAGVLALLLAGGCALRRRRRE
jgi:hypothetical protein